MPNTSKPIFQRRLLPDQPTIADVRSVVRDYAAIIVSVMTHIANRYDRTPFPGLVDTKFDIVTGEDFALHDPRGPRTVYAWIQGRGLEALVGHAAWVRDHPWAEPESRLHPRLTRMIAEVNETMQAMRRKNGGRLFFFHDPAGTPLTFSQDGRRIPYLIAADAPYNFSDLFASRGLFAAAAWLGDAEALAQASAYCQAFEEALLAGYFASDQQKLPPAQPPPPPSPERLSHAPYTIQLATPAMMALHYADPMYIERGLRLMRHVLSRHLSPHAPGPDLDPYDFWEFVDEHGEPYVDEGRLLLDPGHALEFVGLGLKLTRAARQLGMPVDALQAYEQPMHGLLARNFASGFVAASGGIMKGVDLITQTPIDDTMPWWSLPETMRAALACWSVARDGHERQQALRIFAACHNSFMAHYVRTDRHLFAVQTRSAAGQVIDVVPATADADPGYHTGLCLIDVLDILEAETGPLVS